MRPISRGATAAVAAAGGYATLFRLGQTWAPPTRSGSRRWSAMNCYPTPGPGRPTRSRSRRRRRKCGRGWCRWVGDGPAGTPTAGSTGCCSRPTTPAPTRSSPGSSGCRRATGSLTVHRRWTAGSPWSASSRAGCWYCGRPGTCQHPGANAGCRWSGFGAGSFTSRPRGGPGSSSATGCAWTHGGSSGCFWPRSSQRTSSWRGVTCAASGTGSRALLRRRPGTGGSRRPRVCSAAWRCWRGPC